MPSSLTPGSSNIDKFQSSDVDIGLRRDLSGSALPKSRNPFRAGQVLRGFTGSLPLRPVRLLAPLHGSDRLPGQRGLLHPGFQRGRRVAGYDYNSDWTPLLAGLSPAGMAASLAAPEPDLILSHHPARVTAGWLPPSAETWGSSRCRLPEAAHGCLEPPPTKRLRRAYLHLSHSMTLSRLLDTMPVADSRRAS